MTDTYAKLISETQIEIAPTNYVEPSGNIIFNFNNSPEIMAEHEFYQLVKASDIPVSQNYQTISKQYVLETTDSETQIIEKYIVEDDIVKYKQYLVNLLNQWYTNQEQELLPIDDYYVKLEWFNTYSNAYNALKFAEDNLIGVQPSEVIVAINSQLYKNIIVTSSKDLAPLYQKVMIKYNEVIPKRNKLLVTIQNATTISALQAVEAELV